MALATAVAVALTSAVVVGLLPGTATAAPGDADLKVTTAAMSPATGLTGSGGVYELDAANAGDEQRFTFSYTCLSDGTDACVDAAFTIDLTNLTLAGFLPTSTGASGTYTVTHLDGSAAEVDPAVGDPADVRQIVVTFTDAVAGGGSGLGLHTGTSGELMLAATVTSPPGGGDQTGGVTIVPSDNVGAGPTSAVTVHTTFVPVLSSTTSKSWSRNSYLSGATGGLGTSNVATIVGTSTGEPARTLTISDPVVPSTVPSGAQAFNVLELTALGIDTWPLGADTVEVTLWESGVAQPSSGPLDAAAAALWLGGLTDLDDVTGVSFTFAAAAGDVLDADAQAQVSLTTQQLDVTDGVTLGRDGQPVDFSAVGNLSGDLGTLAVGNTAGTVAESDVPGTVPGSSQNTASFKMHDPRPYAGAQKTYAAPDGGAALGQVAIGSYAVATITATNWSRQAVDELSLVERPTQGQIDQNPAALGLGTLSDGMFAGTGFVFAGFGDGFATPGDPASGPNRAVGTWPAGATGATITVTHGDPAVDATATLTEGGPMPQLSDFAGLVAWSDVTGLRVDWTGSIDTGVAASVPYLLTPGASAVPGTYDNHVLATTRLGATTSGPSPRSLDSGNRPIVRAPLTVEAPTVGVDVDKQIPQTHVDVDGGNDGQVHAVLTATSRPGNTEPTRLYIDDRASQAARWWQVMEPTQVDITLSTDVTAQLYYWADGDPDPVLYGSYSVSTPVTLPAGASDWDGLRVVYTRADGFPADTSVQAVVTFEVRDAVTGGGPFVDGESLTNCTAARAEVDYNGTTYDGTAPNACDTVTGYEVVGGGTGPAALVKSVGGAVQEHSGGQTVATLTWGTRGDDLDAVTITDGNGVFPTGDPSEGRTNSFWDTFDLLGVRAITSGPDDAGAPAYDPFLIFDQVTDVQYFDVTDNTWKTLAAASGRPYQGTDATEANGWTVLPELTLTPAERAVAGGVRLVVEPLDDIDRATVIDTLRDAGDWRADWVPTRLTTGAVAATEQPARQVRLDVALRDTSRQTGTVINNAHVYNDADGTAGLVVNDGRVTGVDGGTETDLGGASNHPSQRTVALTPTVLSAGATKEWRRAGDNPTTGADNSAVRDLPLPVGGEPWPSATLTVSARNTSDTPVDRLVLDEPGDTDLAFLGSADNPFSRFAITDVVSLTDVSGVSGATALQVTVAERDPVDGTISTRTVPRADLLAMTELELADVVGITVRYDGRIVSGDASRATLVLATRLLPENRVSGALPAAGMVTDNEVRATVSDARVCVDETTPPDEPCVQQPASDTADDAVTVSDAAVKAFVGKQIDRTSVHRDAGEQVTATLSIQSFGNSAAERLEITDADARYFNAVGLTGIDLVTLPTGAEEAQLEVALAGPGFTVGDDGAYSGPITWVDAGTRTTPGAFTLGADATGAAWSDVLGLRVTFRDTAGELIVSPGTVLGVVEVTGVLRTELVSGGLPSASGAGATWTGEPVTNPAETVTGRVTNVVTGQAYRPGFTSGTPTQSGDTFSVQAGAVEVATTKTAAAGVYAPGDPVDYTIEVTNESSPGTGADTLGLVVTDHLPADGTLTFHPTESLWSASVSPGDDRLGTPTVTHDADAGTVTFAWPDDARLAPGQTVRIELRLFVAEQLSSIQVVNTASVAVPARPAGIPGGGGPDGTTCTAPSVTDPVTDECRVVSPALVLGGANTFASAKWVSTGNPVPVHTTDADPAATCAPRADGDGTWFRFPCVAQTEAGGWIDWQVEVTSLATAPSDSLTIVDMLPTPGDYSALSTGSRGSAWRPVWDGVLPSLVAVPGQNTDATLRVWTTTADYRSGGLPGATAFDPVPGTWTEAFGDLSVADAAEVTGFRFEVSFPSGGRFVSGQSVRIGWAMDAPLGDASSGSDAWNSFAFQVQPEGSPLPLVSVPLKAGVRYTSPSYAAGDVVWLDRDRDGVQDAGEPGVPDVTVRIYEVDSGGVVSTTPRATTTTGPDGRYLFDLLPAGVYVIEFTLDATQAVRYEFTTPMAGADRAADSDAVVGADVTLGRTGVFTLDDSGTNTSLRPVVGADGSAADRIDPTLDAGLVELPVRVGDLVWFDADGDGLQGTGEDGIPGVVLEITGPDGLPVTDIHGAPVGPTTTGPDGRYLFENLPPGQYVVRIDRVASRAALLGYGPTSPGDGSQRETDSATWRDESLVLLGGEQDLSLDFGFVLSAGVGLAISKTPGAVDTTGPTPRVGWDLVVASTGTDDAYAGFTVTDPMPAGLSAVSASGDGFVCTVTAALVTCVHDGELASGETATVHVLTELTGEPGTAVRNVAVVSGDGHPYRTPVPPAQDDGTVVVPEPPADDAGDQGDPEGTQQAVDGPAVLGTTGAQVTAVVVLAVLLTAAGLVLVRVRRRTVSR